MLSVVLILAGILIFGSGLSVLEKAASELSNNDYAFIRYVLIVQDICFFIIPSGIVMILLKSESSARFPELRMPDLKEIMLVVILAFCLFPVTSFTGQINSAMHLPQWLSGVEHWMTEKEDIADNLIEMLIISKTFWVMMLNLIIIALLPAIGEEMIFRGVLQKVFSNLFRSGQLAIWFTAFLFSAIHLQFFGFLPRFILGLVFGYIYYWRGTLWLPVVSHFVNNAFPVALAYIQGMDKFNSPVNTPLLKQALFLPLPIVTGLLILFYFRNKNINKNPVPGKGIKLNEGMNGPEF
jgi:uncharacterized protein